MEIRSFTEKPIKATELMRLYSDVGWWEDR